MNENNSFFRLPKKVRKVSLTKRVSLTQIHENVIVNPHHRSTELHQKKSIEKVQSVKAVHPPAHHVHPVSHQDSKPKRTIFSRFQWLTIVRGQFLKLAEKQVIGKKTLSDIIRQHRYSCNLPGALANQQLFSDFELLEALKESNKTSLCLDDLFHTLANLGKTSQSKVDHRPVEPIQSKKRHDQDLETARFNDDSVRRQFPELHSIRTIQLNSPKNFTIGQPSDFYRTPNEYTNMFENLFRQTCRAIQDLQCLRSSPYEQKLFQQLLSFSIYRSGNDNFYGIKLNDLSSCINNLLEQGVISDFFKYMQAIRLFRCQITLSFRDMFNASLRIINISSNNLVDISFLQQCPQAEFININHNRLKSIQILAQLQHLTEIHCCNNEIQSLFHEHSLHKLRIFDLSYNMLLQMEHIAPLKDIKSLTILNLMGNPLERKNGFKKLMKQTFPQVKGYTFPEAYVFSEYSRFKDIAFFTEADKQET